MRLVIDALARIASEDVPPRLAGADPGVALPLVSSWASFARLPPLAMRETETDTDA